jgi:hypothetical protein
MSKVDTYPTFGSILSPLKLYYDYYIIPWYGQLQRRFTLPEKKDSIGIEVLIKYKMSRNCTN